MTDHPPHVEMILSKIEDLKELFDQRFRSIEDKLDGKCSNCVFVSTLTEKSNSQWFQIKTLWAAVISIWGAMIVLWRYLYLHVAK